MKPQLALVKFKLDSKEEVFEIASMMEDLNKIYQVSLVLIENEHDFAFPSVPIFSGQDLIEFQCPVVALDLLATKYVQLADGRPKLYTPLSTEFGRPSLDEVSKETVYQILFNKQTNNA